MIPKEKTIVLSTNGKEIVMIATVTTRSKFDGIRMTIGDWYENHRAECENHKVRCVFKGASGYYIAHLKAIFPDVATGLADASYRISVDDNTIGINWWEDGYIKVALTDFRFGERVSVLWCAHGDLPIIFIGGEMVEEVLRYQQQGR